MVNIPPIRDVGDGHCFLDENIYRKTNETKWVCLKMDLIGLNPMACHNFPIVPWSRGGVCPIHTHWKIMFAPWDTLSPLRPGFQSADVRMAFNSNVAGWKMMKPPRGCYPASSHTMCVPIVPPSQVRPVVATSRMAAENVEVKLTHPNMTKNRGNLQ